MTAENGGSRRPEALGIQFPSIGGVMGDEKHRSSLASIAAGGRPSSIELDMTDNLAQSACNLILLVGGSF
jgi:hypothetical protein